MTEPEEAICAARQSKASFERGVGVTGKSWERAGQDLFLICLPKFSDRSEFENHYRAVLKLPPTLVDNISDYMVSVQAVFSYGFAKDSTLLSVLSLDLQAEVRQPTDGILSLRLEGHQTLGSANLLLSLNRLYETLLLDV